MPTGNSWQPLRRHSALVLLPGPLLPPLSAGAGPAASPDCDCPRVALLATRPVTVRGLAGPVFLGLSLTHGQFAYRERVTGQWLRNAAAELLPARTVSVHLEMPSGIVTLHSAGSFGVGDVFYLPSPPA
jgi:hypothetical protein